MPFFVLHRNHTHSSRMGHVITFKKGEATYVPPECSREIVQIGGIPADGEDAIDLLDPVKVDPPILSEEERREQLFLAFGLLNERKRRNDFTGQGLPSMTAVGTIVDFEVGKKEVEACWREYCEQKGAE